MFQATAKEAIEAIKSKYKNRLDEPLLITWWDSSDFVGLDLDEAFSNAENALEVCVGHINDYVDENTEGEVK